PGGEDRTVGPQHRRTKLLRARILEPNDGAPGVDPLIQRWNVSLGARSGDGIDGQNGSVRQQGPSFLVVAIVLRWIQVRIGERSWIQPSYPRVEGMREQEGSIRQNRGLRIADVSPVGRGRELHPGVRNGIIDEASIAPDWTTAQDVLTTGDDDPPVGEHGGRV